MSNRWSLLRTNLTTAVRQIVPPTVYVDEIAAPIAIGALPMPSIGVCRAGGRGIELAEPTIGYHLNQDSEVVFQLVVRCDDATTNIAALRAAEQLASDAMAVRNVNIGISGTGDATDTGSVFCDYVKDDVLAFPGRDGGAGPIALVISLRTTALPT
jgi:hypothetical protein